MPHCVSARSPIYASRATPKEVVTVESNKLNILTPTACLPYAAFVEAKDWSAAEILSFLSPGKFDREIMKVAAIHHDTWRAINGKEGFLLFSLR